jgi:hypothetical protein
LSKTSELINLSFFQNNNFIKTLPQNVTNLSLYNTSSSNAQNFNLFEYSQLWNNKKFFFTNQLKLQVSHLGNLPNQNYYQITTTGNNMK